MSRPTLEQLPRDYSWAAYLVTVVVFSLLFNPVVVALAVGLLWMKRRKPRLRRYIWISAVLATGWLIYWPGIFVFLLTEGMALTKAVLIGLPLVPLVTICLELSSHCIKVLKPLSHSAWIIRLRNLILKEQEQIREALIAEAKHEPPGVDSGTIMLGPIWPEEKHIDFPKTMNVVIKSSKRFIHSHPAQWLGMRRKILPEHTLIIGQTGSGKSEAIKRYAFEIATQTDFDLLLVDGKGDDALCDEFRAICKLGNRGRTPVFRLGHATRPSHPYDGFQGTGLAVQNRLMALLKLDEVSGDSKYYAKAATLVLQLLCQKDPNGTPRSFHQLLQRCNLNYLEVAFKDDLTHLAQVKTLKEKDFTGLVYELSILANDLASVVNPNGFKIGGKEGVRSAVFSLKTQSAGVSAEQYFEMLILDLLDVMGNRQTRPMMIIIDELRNITKNPQHLLQMITMGRSSEQGVIVASQSPTNLGDAETTAEIVYNIRNRLLLASDRPDAISELAGTILQVEQTLQTQDGDNTNMGTVGARETFAITPNDVGQLAAGEAYFIRQRFTKKLLVKQVTDLPSSPPEPQAAAYIPEAPDIPFQGKRLTL